MLYILEGCDGVGKTTLARQLAPILDADVVHCSAETPNTFEFFRDVVSGSITHNIIADRFCYGQFVYQKPEERPMTEQELFQLEAYMISCGVKLIWVYADARTINDRLIRRGEKTSKPVEEINDGFKKIFQRGIIRPLIWTTTVKENCL